MDKPIVFEIGVIYRKSHRYFLAVSDRKLITFKDGMVEEIRPYVRYDVVRSISVEELCNRWAITLECFDAAVAHFLTPSSEQLKPRPRGTRRQKTAEDAEWQRQRIARLQVSVA